MCLHICIHEVIIPWLVCTGYGGPFREWSEDERADLWRSETSEMGAEGYGSSLDRRLNLL